MAREFKRLIDATPYYKIGVLIGGWYVGSLKSRVWTQERTVLEIDSLGVAATANISVTAGLGMTEEITTNIEVSFVNNSVQYVDITDVLRSVFDRSKPALLTDTATPGRIVIVFLDAYGSPIFKDPYQCDFSYYDALPQSVNADSCVGISDRWLLPDTFRIPDMLCNKYEIQACTRITRGADKISIHDAGGDTIDYVDSLTEPATYGWNFVPATGPFEVKISNLSQGLIEKARVITETCMDDKIFLTWWSPIFGGWKSVIAEVMGEADEVSESEKYILGWDYGEAKGGMLGVRVKIPNCTTRDYDYYRDIYYSRIVQVYDEALWSYNYPANPIEKEVMVKGNPPQPKLNGYVDLEMTLMTAEVSSIW